MDGVHATGQALGCRVGAGSTHKHEGAGGHVDDVCHATLAGQQQQRRARVGVLAPLARVEAVGLTGGRLGRAGGGAGPRVWAGGGAGRGGLAGASVGRQCAGTSATPMQSEQLGVALPGGMREQRGGINSRAWLTAVPQRSPVMRLF